MHLYGARGDRVELDFVGEVPTPAATSRAGVAAVGAGVVSGALASVVAGVFDVRADRVIRSAWGTVREAADEPTPAVFRERESGLVRVTGREIVLRFRPGLSDTKRRTLLKARGLELRRRNLLVPDQIVAVDRARRGPELVDRVQLLRRI